MCAKEGCDRRATHSVLAKVPAKGYFPLSKPLEIFCQVGLCKDHAEAEVKSGGKGLFGSEFQATITDLVTAALGRVPPDWGRAEFKAIRLDSPEYQEFQLQLHTKGTVH